MEGHFGAAERHYDDAFTASTSGSMMTRMPSRDAAALEPRPAAVLEQRVRELEVELFRIEEDWQSRCVDVELVAQRRELALEEEMVRLEEDWQGRCVDMECRLGDQSVLPDETRASATTLTVDLLVKEMVMHRAADLDRVHLFESELASPQVLPVVRRSKEQELDASSRQQRQVQRMEQELSLSRATTRATIRELEKRLAAALESEQRTHRAERAAAQLGHRLEQEVVEADGRAQVLDGELQSARAAEAEARLAIATARQDEAGAQRRLLEEASLAGTMAAREEAEALTCRRRLATREQAEREARLEVEEAGLTTSRVAIKELEKRLAVAFESEQRWLQAERTAALSRARLEQEAAEAQSRAQLLHGELQTALATQVESKHAAAAARQEEAGMLRRFYEEASLARTLAGQEEAEALTCRRRLAALEQVEKETQLEMDGKVDEMREALSTTLAKGLQYRNEWWQAAQELKACEAQSSTAVAVAEAARQEAQLEQKRLREGADGWRLQLQACEQRAGAAEFQLGRALEDARQECRTEVADLKQEAEAILREKFCEYTNLEADHVATKQALTSELASVRAEASLYKEKLEVANSPKGPDTGQVLLEQALAQLRSEYLVEVEAKARATQAQQQQEAEALRLRGEAGEVVGLVDAVRRAEQEQEQWKREAGLLQGRLDETVSSEDSERTRLTATKQVFEQEASELRSEASAARVGLEGVRRRLMEEGEEAKALAAVRDRLHAELATDGREAQELQLLDRELLLQERDQAELEASEAESLAAEVEALRQELARLRDEQAPVLVKRRSTYPKVRAPEAALNLLAALQTTAAVERRLDQLPELSDAEAPATPGSPREKHFIQLMREAEALPPPLWLQPVQRRLRPASPKKFAIPDTAKRGITLQQFVNLADTVRWTLEKHEVLEDDPHSPIFEKALTWEDIVMYSVATKFVLPVTRLHKCSYVEWVANTEQPPEWFCSHWWGTPFAATTQMLKHHAATRDSKSAMSVVYWICTFANNQHNLAELGEVNVMNTPFVRALQRVDCIGTLLLCDSKVTPLSRVWCILEVYITEQLRSGALRGVAFGADHKPAHLLDVAVTRPYVEDGGGEDIGPGAGQRLATAMLMDAISGNWAQSTDTPGVEFPLEVAQIGVEVDVTKAQSSVPEDGNAIFNYIATERCRREPAPKGHPNYDKLNQFVHSVFLAAALYRVLRLRGSNCVEEARLLLQRRANPNVCVQEGNSALFALIGPAGRDEVLGSGADRRLSLLNLLLGFHADPNRFNAENQTVLDRASEVEMPQDFRATLVRDGGAKTADEVDVPANEREVNDELGELLKGFSDKAFGGLGGGDDGTKLLGPGIRTLKAIAAVLLRYPKALVLVQMSSHKNRAPERRLQKVKTTLASYGCPEDRLEVVLVDEGPVLNVSVFLKGRRPGRPRARPHAMTP